jgi:hypothetical protein
MMTSRKLSDLIAEADALSSVEYLTETNAGTYGATEACKAVGSGSPEFADYRHYQTVGGAHRRTGCDAARAPGRARYLNSDDLRADRKRLAELKKEIRAAR